MQELNINGYIVTEEMKSENAGNSVWGCAFKNNQKYFIKQLKETYCDIPYEEATAFQKEDIEANQRFYSRMQNLYAALRRADNGNLIIPIEFMKQDGHYYIISEWIDQFSDFSEIQTFTDLQKYLMMKVLTYSLCGLSENHIVHCDLKPDNIRIKDTISRAKTLKIIDFDNGFIQGDYPDITGGTQNYMAPEVFIRMNQEESGTEPKIDITPQADIFSLGIIFHEIITGTLPESADPDFPYLGLAVGYGIPVLLKEMPAEYADLIQKMLRSEPSARPSASEVFEILRNIDPLTLNNRR